MFMAQKISWESWNTHLRLGDAIKEDEGQAALDLPLDIILPQNSNRRLCPAYPRGTGSFHREKVCTQRVLYPAYSQPESVTRESCFPGPRFPHTQVVRQRCLDRPKNFTNSSTLKKEIQARLNP